MLSSLAPAGFKAALLRRLLGSGPGWSGRLGRGRPSIAGTRGGPACSICPVIRLLVAAYEALQVLRRSFTSLTESASAKDIHISPVASDLILSADGNGCNTG